MSCGEIPLEVSGNGSGTGPRMGMLGTLSEEGTVGTIALNGVVGVKCEGILVVHNIQLTPLKYYYGNSISSIEV